LVINDEYVILDGLNGNVDIFSLENFDYLASLDIKEETLLSAYY